MDMKKSVGLCLLLLLMLLNSGAVTEGARYGLLLWYTSVVPALFPFMVLSGLITAGGGVRMLMTPVHALLHRLIPISKNGCYVLVSGLLCGYPMGAKTCADFVREGRITAREGRFLMAICNHPSPMFLLGYVYPFFAERIKAWVLLTAVYGPVAVLAIAAKRVYFGGENRAVREESSGTPEGRKSAGFPGKDAGNSLASSPTVPALTSGEAILSSADILIKIGGCLMLFSIAIVLLRRAVFLPVPFRLALIGAMEMTTGIRELAASLPFPLSGAASMAALTFGGFSGLAQTQAVLGPADESESASAAHVRYVRNPESMFSAQVRRTRKKNAGLSIRQYFFWKLLHGALSAGTFLILCR